MPKTREQGKGQDEAKSMELDRLFEQEVRTRQENIRRQAVQSVLTRRDFGEDLSVQDFLKSLQGAPDMWDVVSSMSIVTFAECICNVRQVQEENARLRAEIASLRSSVAHNGARPSKRTRLSNAQKDGLKRAIIYVLGGQPEGLPRLQLAAQLPDARLRELGLPRGGIAAKLRIPIVELLAERVITTRGEKRFMRYLLSDSAERASPQNDPRGASPPQPSAG